jgi:hypothetical protein
MTLCADCVKIEDTLLDEWANPTDPEDFTLRDVHPKDAAEEESGSESDSEASGDSDYEVPPKREPALPSDMKEQLLASIAAGPAKPGPPVERVKAKARFFATPPSWW